MKKDKRFERIYKQTGFTTDISIWVDRETGVHYLQTTGGYGGGVTVLLDAEGKPVIDRHAGE